jgi:hypothetical protein
MQAFVAKRRCDAGGLLRARERAMGVHAQQLASLIEQALGDAEFGELSRYRH